MNNRDEITILRMENRVLGELLDVKTKVCAELCRMIADLERKLENVSNQ